MYADMYVSPALCSDKTKIIVIHIPVGNEEMYVWVYRKTWLNKFVLVYRKT